MRWITYRATSAGMPVVGPGPPCEVTARITQSATHQGDLMGIAPTGKRVTLPGIAIYRIVEGKIIDF